MENIWDRAEELLTQGKPFVLATIIRTRGSVPREVGAKMVVPQEGQPFGTIGGGCGEGEVLRRAYPLFDQKIPSRVVQVDLTGDFDQEEIQVCGGIMDVALNLWRPEEHKDVVHALAEASRARRTTALITTIHPIGNIPAGAKSCMAVTTDRPALTPNLPLSPAIMQKLKESVSAGAPQLFSITPDGQAVKDTSSIDQEWPRLFIDVQPGLETLVIVGAGHIAQPLAEIGYMLGFRTIVIDDRWAFANRERFPNATEILVGPFAEILEGIDINEQTFAVIVTRGHTSDEISLRTILKRKVAYVGMIGSKRRAKATLEHLLELGYSAEDLGRVHTPMGLDIAAETPAEIAVAIAAEIIRIRRRGPIETISLAAKTRPGGPLKFTSDAN